MWLKMGVDCEAVDKGTGTCFYGMFRDFGTLVYMDAQFPRPGCGGRALGFRQGRSGSSLKQGGRGWRVCGGEEGIERRGRSVNC